MTKVALLIGVSEYESPHLKPLPAVTQDIEGMQRVLQDQEIGGFDDVKTLTNPDPVAMQEAIQILFSNSQKNDLVLLYFSGHGIRDDSGRLYFATRITRKNEQGELSKASTVSADYLHDIIKDSRSKRQVIILDCCFSGAFAKDIKGKDEVYLDFKKIQLGGEGRAVLTSSTSTQYSFESIYTHYLVQGIETGEADENNDGFISVDELHQYVQRKVQENKPEMKPQIQAVIKEGYNIVLAKAPIHNRENIYKGIVKSWVRDGYISDIGRAALNEQQKRLEIEPDKASASEEEVLKPYKEYERKLQLYQEVFYQIIQKKYPISNEDLEELKRFKQSFGLIDTDITKLENSVIIQWQTKIKKSKKIKFSPLVKLFLLASLCFCIGFLFRAVTTLNETNIRNGDVNKICQKPPQYNPATIITQQGLNISSGEKNLLGGEANSEKQAGVNAFASKNFTEAIKHLESWRQSHKNDPETLIYLNNAKASNKSTLKIGVGVPIGTNPDVAQEILRGVAQAQDEANQKGINSKLLQVVIANDDNDPNIAKQVAKKFVEDANVLAVVGHNVSDASEAAATVYEERHLVMVSPTSFSLDFSKSRKYIFRTVPNTYVVANVLSNYTINTAHKKNIVICVDENATDNMSFRNSFIDFVDNKWNKIPCNLSSNLNPSDLIDQAIKNGADSILLAPHVNRINKALEVAQANQGRLALFGTPTLYTSKTLQGGQAINGMVLAVPWYPTAIPGNQFSQNARNLWGGPVTWRTAMAYDATKAIIAGLQQSNSREELQQVMHNTEKFFADNGSNGGKIEFLPSGDRKGTAITVKVQPNPQKICEFVQVPES